MKSKRKRNFPGNAEARPTPMHACLKLHMQGQSPVTWAAICVCQSITICITSSSWTGAPLNRPLTCVYCSIPASACCICSRSWCKLQALDLLEEQALHAVIDVSAHDAVLHGSPDQAQLLYQCGLGTGKPARLAAPLEEAPQCRVMLEEAFFLQYVLECMQARIRSFVESA
jgi:hypothetical protein